jgi:hypothetical protein
MDTGTIDVMEVLQTIPGVVRSEFFIQRISGLSKILRDSDLRFDILGFSFGPNSSELETEYTELSIEGTPVNFRAAPSGASHTTGFTINNADLSKYLPQGKTQSVVYAALKIRTRKKGLLGFWKSWDDYSVPLTFHLFPEYAGSVTITGTYRKLEWIPDPESPLKWAHATPSYNYPGGMPENVYTNDVDAHHRLSNPRLSTEGANPRDGLAFSNFDPRLPPPA